MENMKNTTSSDQDPPPALETYFFPMHVPKKRRTNPTMKKATKTDEKNSHVKKSRVKKPKKRVVLPDLNAPPPKMPVSHMTKVDDLCGWDVKLVIEKRLFRTDVDKGCSRLSLPISQLQADFLTKEENDSLGGNKSMTVSLIEPCVHAMCDLPLKRWNSGSLMYALTSDAWYNVVQRNGLQAGDRVQLWSFRVQLNLYFALIKFPA